MKTFHDNQTRPWALAINVTTIKRVRDAINVDLLEAASGDLIKRLQGDPILLVDLLFTILKPSADAAGVTDEQFGEAMAGDAIEHAAEALMQELADFFPSAKRRMIQAALAKTREITGQAEVQVIAKIEAMDAADLMRLALGDSATSSPA